MSTLKVDSINNPAATSGGLVISEAGIPTAPTAAAGTNTTQLATTAFVANANKVLQTVSYNSTSTITATNMGQFASVEKSVTITPISSSSRILILADYRLLHKVGTASYSTNSQQLMVKSVSGVESSLSSSFSTMVQLSVGTNGYILPFGFSNYDDHGTTSPITYILRIYNLTPGAGVEMTIYPAMFTLVEVSQ